MIRLLRNVLGRRRPIVAIAAIAVLATAGASWAYFKATGTGTASASTGLLSAPTTVVGTPGAGTVALSWHAVTPPASGTVSYYVTRSGGAPGGNCPTSTAPTTVTSCTDAGLAAGTYHYTVTAIWQSWSATSTTTNVTLSSGALDHFTVSAPATAGAGTAFNVTITAKDSSGNTVSGYTGLQSLGFSGPASSPGATAPAYPATVTFTGGVGTASITLYDAQTTTITAAQGAASGASGNVAVSPAVATAFKVPTPAAQTAGTAFNETLTATDPYGNTATSYTGAKTITFSGPANSPGATTPTYPSTVTFTSGAGTASITLYDAQTTTLTATQGTASGVSGSFTVSAAGATAFKVPTPAAQTAGTAFNETLTATDPYGNTATSYTGAKTITFSGPANSPGATAPTYPSTVTFTSGIGTASITLYDAQTTTLTATQSTLTGVSGSFTVSAAGATAFKLPTPAAQTAGTAFNETLTATDPYGNTATSYTGAKTITFSGPANSPGATAPTYPSTVTFTSGAGTASITLYDAQTTTLTATQSTLTGVSGSFTVGASAPTRLAITSAAITGPKSSTPNLGPITVAEQDAYGNPTTTAMTLALTSTGTTGKFAATHGGTAITTVSIPSGSSTATFWYGNSTVGGPTITVAKSGLTSATQQETISSVVGLGIVITGGTGNPVIACGTASGNYTCTITGVGAGGSVTFNVTFVNSAGVQTIYSSTTASTILESGENTGSVAIAANASSSSPNTLTASHTGGSAKTSTLTFGSFTLKLSVGS